MARVFAASAFVVFLMSASSVQAATYYTSLSGSDSYSCAQAQAVTTPKRSINSGITCLKPGDTLWVRGGTYDETLIGNVVAGTSWAAPVRIAAFPGETVWMSPTSAANPYIISFAHAQQYVEFDGINLDGRRRLAPSMVNISAWSGGNAHHIRFKNLEVILGTNGIANEGTASGAFGFLLVNDKPGSLGGNEFINLKVHGGGDPGDLTYAFYIQSNDNLVDGCDCYDAQGLGIQIYNSNAGGMPVNNTIRNSRIYGTRPMPGYSVGGLLVDGIDTKVYNNVIFGMRNPSGTAFGIMVYGGASSGNEIYNNTLYDNQNYGIFLDGGTSTSVVKNNISYWSYDDLIDYGSGTVTSNNLFGTDPKFVNTTTGDLRLQATSPAKDAGTPIGMVSTDLTGLQRPQAATYDIGAYEVASKPPPSAPTNVRVF